MVSGRGAKESDWSQLERQDPAVQARSRSALTSTLVLVVFGLILALQRGGGVRDCFTTLLSLVGIWIASVFAHELGHVAAAFAVRLTPFLLLVGGGPSLVRAEAFGVAIDVGSLPGGGLTTIAARSLPRIKWRLLVTYAAGPLVSAALLMTGLWVAPREWAAFTSGSTSTVSPAVALVLVNGWLVFTSALPFPSGNDSSRPRRNDANGSERVPEIPRSLPLATPRYAPTGFRFRYRKVWGSSPS